MIKIVAHANCHQFAALRYNDALSDLRYKHLGRLRSRGGYIPYDILKIFVSRIAPATRLIASTEWRREFSRFSIFKKPSVTNVNYVISAVCKNYMDADDDALDIDAQLNCSNMASGHGQYMRNS